MILIRNKLYIYDSVMKSDIIDYCDGCVRQEQWQHTYRFVCYTQIHMAKKYILPKKNTDKWQQILEVHCYEKLN